MNRSPTKPFTDSETDVGKQCTNAHSLHSFSQVLIMDGSYIKELSENIFSSRGLIYLQKISIKNANIQSIHESAFSDLKILKEINLSGNNITVLPQQAFKDNDRLRTLVIGGNNINK